MALRNCKNKYISKGIDWKEIMQEQDNFLKPLIQGIRYCVPLIAPNCPVNVRARARHDTNLNENLAAVFRNIESSAKGSDSEDDLKGLGKENVRQGFFGQEINLTIYNLCRINMFLHDVNYNHFDIANGDTLIDPKHWIAYSD